MRNQLWNVFIVFIFIFSLAAASCSPDSDELADCNDMTVSALKEKCFLNVAKCKKDVSICTKIKDAGLLDMCYWELATEFVSADNCLHIKEQETKDLCFMDIARLEKKEVHCDKIKTESHQNSCYALFSSGKVDKSKAPVKNIRSNPFIFPKELLYILAALMVIGFIYIAKSHSHDSSAHVHLESGVSTGIFAIDKQCGGLTSHKAYFIVEDSGNESEYFTQSFLHANAHLSKSGIRLIMGELEENVINYAHWFENNDASLKENELIERILAKARYDFKHYFTSEKKGTIVIVTDISSYALSKLGFANGITFLGKLLGELTEIGTVELTINTDLYRKISSHPALKNYIDGSFSIKTEKKRHYLKAIVKSKEFRFDWKPFVYTDGELQFSYGIL